MDTPPPSDAFDSGAVVFRFEDLPWRSRETDAVDDGLRGKLLAQGEGGFYVQHVEMSPGYEVSPHSHSENEVIIVLDGDCEFGPERAPLRRFDSAVLHAGEVYGFSVGPQGMRFLIVRTGEATLRRDDDGSRITAPGEDGAVQQDDA